jgi:lysozyme
MQATSLMLSTLKTYEDCVNRYVQVPLTQNRFDALVDFAYNAGAQNLRTSTLLKLLNAKDYIGAAEQFTRWIYADGEILGGLVKRRLSEKLLFLTT